MGLYVVSVASFFLFVLSFYECFDELTPTLVNKLGCHVIFIHVWFELYVLLQNSIVDYIVKHASPQKRNCSLRHHVYLLQLNSSPSDPGRPTLK